MAGTTFAASTPVSTSHLELRFQRLGIERGEVRELEMWAQREHAVTPAVDLTERELPSNYLRAAADPSNDQYPRKLRDVQRFALTTAALLRTAYLVYERGGCFAHSH